jgi:N-acetylglutamate synthase-like GNAT family acetyltransferase
MVVSFRFAGTDDIEALHSLIERAYRGEEALKSWTSEASLLNAPRTSAAELREMLSSEKQRFVVAEIDSRVVGCALIERRGADGYFGMLSIDPRMQTAGLGSALLLRIEADVRELWNCSGMTLRVVNLRREMIEWYERRGYSLTGLREPFPFDLHPAAHRSDFDFVEMRKAFY